MHCGEWLEFHIFGSRQKRYKPQSVAFQFLFEKLLFSTTTSNEHDRTEFANRALPSKFHSHSLGGSRRKTWPFVSLGAAKREIYHA